ncbi:MAG: signal peptidase II [Alphaproteobacteria bacterium]|nr:signal peptidase II [Alphaproteobacteria bacterium]
MRIGLIVAFIATLIDQITKWWFMEVFLKPPTNYVHIMPSLNIVKAWNKGISFSMFSSEGDVGRWVLVALSLSITIWLLTWLRKEKDKYTLVALGLIIGGAVGNMIDRIRIGAVADFIDVYYGTYHWPAFNGADSFIFIGAAIILISSFVCDKNIIEDKGKDENKDTEEKNKTESKIEIVEVETDIKQ